MQGIPGFSRKNDALEWLSVSERKAEHPFLVMSNEVEIGEQNNRRKVVDSLFLR